MTTRLELHQVLAQTPAFAALTENGLEWLSARVRLRHFRYGERLLVQRVRGVEVQVILRGRVRMERSHPNLRSPVVLGEKGPGGVVGIDGLLEGCPCQETVRAMVGTQVLAVPAQALRDLCAILPREGDAVVAALVVAGQVCETEPEPADSRG